MKIIFLTVAKERLSNHTQENNSSGKGVACQRTNLSRSAHGKEQWAHFQWFHPQMMTHQLPRWRFIFLGQLLPLKIHTLAQQSGSSIVAFDSLVKGTNFMTVFMHFLHHSVGEHLCFRCQRELFVHTLELRFPKIQMQIVFATSAKSTYLNILSLAAPGILRWFLLNQFISCFDGD